MFDIIYNPVAGKGKALSAIKTVTQTFDRLGIAYRTHETTKPGGAKDLTEEVIKAGATDILAMGGDGTIHEVVSGFSNFENCNLGIIPCGTGNDFAAVLGISEKPEEALLHVVEGIPTYTDYFETPACRGINMAGAGIDVDVLRRYYRKKKRNKGTYLRSLISAAFHHKPYRFTVTMNGETFTTDCFIVAVGNGDRFGGGIAMCPEAIPDDGLLDVVTVANVKKIGIPGAFIKLMRKKILKFKKTRFERTDEIRVTSDLPITMNVDGELYENADFSVKIVHDKLKIYRLPKGDTSSAQNAAQESEAENHTSNPEAVSEAAASEV